MLLSAITSVFSALLITQGTIAALTPQQVVANNNLLATYSKDTNTQLSQLSKSAAPSEVAGSGSTLVANFQKIIDSLSGDIAAMQATPPIANAKTQPIVDSLKNFVSNHQALQSDVISKHPIFAQFGVTAPIAASLRTLEAAINSFGSAMIDLIPSRKAEVQTDKDQLDQSIGNSITVYDQFCVPSPLYPAVNPVCSS